MCCAFRDHKLNHYYYRVANSPQWKRIAMNEVNWRSMTSIRYMKVRQPMRELTSNQGLRGFFNRVSVAHH